MMTESVFKKFSEDGKQGLCCLECRSVYFNIGGLLKHLRNNPSHKFYKSGDNVVLNIKFLCEVEPQAIQHYEYLQEKLEVSGNDGDDKNECRP